MYDYYRYIYTHTIYDCSVLRQTSSKGLIFTSNTIKRYLTDRVSLKKTYPLDVILGQNEILVDIVVREQTFVF